MKEMDYHDPVQEVREALDREDTGLWLLPIVVAIESQRKRSAIDWGVEFLRGRLDHVEPHRRTIQEHWLTELETFKSIGPEADDVLRRGREIWYYEGDRDELQTAIARLYEALAALLKGDFAGYSRATAMAVAVSLLDARGRPVPDRVQEVVESFDRWRGSSRGHNTSGSE